MVDRAASTRALPSGNAMTRRFSSSTGPSSALWPGGASNDHQPADSSYREPEQYTLEMISSKGRANPLSRSRNSWADGDGCVGLPPSTAHFLKSHQLLVQKFAADRNRQKGRVPS